MMKKRYYERLIELLEDKIAEMDSCLSESRAAENDKSFEKLANDQADYIRKLHDDVNEATERADDNSAKARRLEAEIARLKTEPNDLLFANEQLQGGMKELKEKHHKAADLLRDARQGSEQDVAVMEALAVLNG